MTILVVEDEELLREAISKLLRRLGLMVVEACDGSEAMDLLRAHRDDLEAVLLDFTLPGTPSVEILDTARTIRPDIKVVVTSAYGKETVDATFGVRGYHFVRKPFRLDELLRILTEPAA